MTKLETRDIPVFIHEEIAGEPVDTTGTPFKTDLVTENLPAVTQHVAGGSNNVLSSPSQFHGRSYILDSGVMLAPEDTPAWHDQYGNPFAVLSTKGNNFSDARLIESGTAPSGFIPYGLQEGDALLRVLRASRLMREIGIDTEWPVFIGEPKEMIYQGETVEPQLYKQRLIADLVNQKIVTGGDEEATKSESLGTKEISERAIAINGMEFFITVRATATVDRLLDIVHGGYLDRAKLNTAIDSFNKMAASRRTLLERLDLPKSLDNIDQDSDKIGEVEFTFFSEVVAKSVGYYLGLMHKVGLRHGFPHLGNITSLGGLVDLDSVRGEPLSLDDKETDPNHMASDLRYILRDFSEEFASTNTESLYDCTRIVENFNRNMIDQYLEARNLSLHDATSNHDYLEISLLIYQYYSDEGGNQDRRRIDIIDRLFPEAHKRIGAAADMLLTDFGPRYTYVSPRDMARYVYWSYLDRNMSEVWHRTLGGEPDTWRLFTADEMPTEDALEAGLAATINNVLATNAFESVADLSDVSFLGNQMAEKKVKDLPARLRLYMSARSQQLTAEMYEPGSKNYLIALPTVLRKLNLAMTYKLASNMPDNQMVTDEVMQIFRDRYLAKQEHATIPDQQLIAITAEELKDYDLHWEHGLKGLSCYYSGVPAEMIMDKLAPSIQSIKFNTSSEALRSNYNTDERICLVLTDGDTNDYSEVFEDDKGNELENTYLQFTSTTKATYAFFLIRSNDGSYRAEYNIVAPDDRLTR